MYIDKSQKGFSQILVVLLVAILVGLGLYFTLGQTTTPAPGPTQPAIQNDQDLMKTSGELDKVNVDSLDSQVDQVVAGDSTF